MIVAQEIKIEELLPVNIGIDIGQIHDPTAICVTEVDQVPTGEVRYGREQTIGYHDDHGNWIPPKGIENIMVSEYMVRFIKRLPLNTSYHDVAEYISNMLKNDLFQNRKVRVLIDVTGVGRPVYDNLKRKIFIRLNNAEVTHMSVGIQFKMSSNHMLQLKPISFVHGEIYNRGKGTLGKAFLVSHLQSILQEKRFHAPDIPEVKAMCDELLVYEIKITDNGKDTYGAKIGKHDDLATAAALACLEDPYSDKVRYSEKVY
ncbi:MAG TPA: hypothetical protein VF974_06040 [Patescibacteria group bacterium]